MCGRVSHAHHKHDTTRAGAPAHAITPNTPPTCSISPMLRSRSRLPSGVSEQNSPVTFTPSSIDCSTLVGACRTQGERDRYVGVISRRGGCMARAATRARAGHPPEAGHPGRRASCDSECADAPPQLPVAAPRRRLLAPTQPHHTPCGRCRSVRAPPAAAAPAAAAAGAPRPASAVCGARPAAAAPAAGRARPHGWWHSAALDTACWARSGSQGTRNHDVEVGE
jgi:hypothetical protein